MEDLPSSNVLGEEIFGMVSATSGQIQGAGSASTRAFHDMEINHGGFDAGVPQEGLDGANIGAGFE